MTVLRPDLAVDLEAPLEAKVSSQALTGSAVMTWHGRTWTGRTLSFLPDGPCNDLLLLLVSAVLLQFGEAFSLRWKVLNTSAGVLSARVVIQDPPSASPIEAPLLWGGRREFVIQVRLLLCP